MNKWKWLNRIRSFPINATWILIYPFRWLVFLPALGIVFVSTDWENWHDRDYALWYIKTNLRWLIDPFHFFK